MRHPLPFLTSLTMLLAACGTAPTVSTEPSVPTAQAGPIPQPPQALSPAAADTSGAPTQATFPAASEHADAALTSTIIDAPNATFGYDIFSNGKLFLHQTNLPGQPGNDGCKTKADAEKLAAFVIGKIKKGEMPPTVTTDELKKLEVLH